MTFIDTPDFPRDRWGNPQVTDPDGSGRLISYGRPSSLGKVIDNTYNLDLWAKRKVLEGLVKDHAIYATACALTFDDTSKEAKKAVNKVVDDAMAAVRSDARAELGTALHLMSARLDRGEVFDLPPVFAADLAAYRQALTAARLTVVSGMIELNCVCDELQQAGTFDRILQDEDGVCYPADVKTGGTVDYPHSYGVQVATYGHSQLYDIATGQRRPMPPRLNLERGVIIHLPAGEARCHLYWIDLIKGWEAAKAAHWAKYVWQKDKTLLEPIIRIGITQSAEVVALRARINALTDEQRTQLRRIWPTTINLRTATALSEPQRLHLEALIDGMDYIPA